MIPGLRSDDERWLLKLHRTATKPETIVLTREDYLGFNADRSAQSSLVKATLMTRHLLFVGFGVKDPHFHEIVHDVRRAVPDKSQPFGTVLTVAGDTITQKLWQHDLDFVAFPDGRMLEIFLDATLAFGATSTSYLLDKNFFTALSPGDQSIATAFEAMVGSLPGTARSGDNWRAVDRMLQGLGWQSASDKHSSSTLPEGLT